MMINNGSLYLKTR